VTLKVMTEVLLTADSAPLATRARVTTAQAKQPSISTAAS